MLRSLSIEVFAWQWVCVHTYGTCMHTHISCVYLDIHCMFLAVSRSSSRPNLCCFACGSVCTCILSILHRVVPTYHPYLIRSFTLSFSRSLAHTGLCGQRWGWRTSSHFLLQMPIYFGRNQLRGGIFERLYVGHKWWASPVSWPRVGTGAHVCIMHTHI